MPDPTDGVLGMAWPDLEDNNMTVVFQQMIDQGVVDAPVFGFYLNRYYAVYTSLVLELHYCTLTLYNDYCHTHSET